MSKNRLTFFKNTCLTATGLLLTLTLLNILLVPFETEEDLGILSYKKATLLEKSNNYDAIFLGTSQTFRNIDPDSLTQSSSCKLSVYNAGVPGLVLEELNDFISVIEKSGAKNKIVIFTDPLPPRPDFNAVTNIRTQHYTTYTNFSDRYQNIWSLPAPFWKKTALSGFSMGAYVYEFLGIGTLSKILFPELNAAPDVYLPGLDRDNGYPDLEADIKNSPEIAARASRFKAISDKWADTVLEKQKSIKEPSENMVASSEKRAFLIKNLAAKIEAQGNIPALIVFPEPPTHREDLALASAVKKIAPGLSVINGYDETVAQDLWNENLWFDETHLNMEGAAIFSKNIAPQICEIRTAKESDK